MCTTCGCSDGANVTVTGEESLDEGHANHHHDRHGHHLHDHDHDHDYAHDHAHAHDHDHVRTTVTLEENVLAANDRQAEQNRGWLAAQNILALNLVSSPGAGKTTLLERTIRDLGGRLPVSVVEGDQETVFDARRIRAAGARAVQVNTGTGCHLEAGMLARAIDELEPPRDSLLMIENVGNLVCPALFDLGERAKVVILSVTEGADKPLKYPHMFRASDLLVISKTDLLPHVDFDVAACEDSARRIQPDIDVVRLSTKTGEGLAGWYDWIDRCIAGRGGGLAAGVKATA